jgi:glycosyltransferase involved in cell wall biosynthesis
MLDEDPEAAALRHVADECGVSHRVRFVGAVDRHDAPSLLRSCDVVCCTPWYEPFGLVAVEAMACGVPVVASRVGGLAETVVDGGTGFLVPARSPEAIAEAIAELATDDIGRRMMGSAARERAQTYGWDRIGARTLTILRRLALTGRTRGALPPPACTDAPIAAGTTSDSTVAP